MGRIPPNDLKLVVHMAGHTEFPILGRHPQVAGIGCLVRVMATGAGHPPLGVQREVLGDLDPVAGRDINWVSIAVLLKEGGPQ